MEPPRIRKRVGPEAEIQEEIIKFLRFREWYVKPTHGNMYQSGFADLYCAHHVYGTRWIEVKNPKAYSFTPAQLAEFPRMTAAGVGIWILTAATESEYALLWKPANWYVYYANLNQRTANFGPTVAPKIVAPSGIIVPPNDLTGSSC